jgi:hypothetical protein
MLISCLKFHVEESTASGVGETLGPQAKKAQSVIVYSVPAGF